MPAAFSPANAERRASLAPARRWPEVLLAAAACAFAGAGHAQIGDAVRGAPDEANHFIATPDGWQHPLTPWGDPDIGAVLDMMQASRVPLERCGDRFPSRLPPTFLFGERVADEWQRPCDMMKAWKTEPEHEAELEAWRATSDVSRAALVDGDLALSLTAGATDPSLPQRQTSLIVDPPDGLLPALTPEGKRRALQMRSSWALPGENHTYDDATDFDTWDRCVTRGMPSSMMPYRYNGGLRILQSPGYVVLQLEMIHEVRIIPVGDARPLPGAIRQYLGEARGRWDGTTLVIETTNYREGPPMVNLGVLGAPPGNRFPASSRMKTTERILRLNDDWWLYEITTEDPVVLTRPFTVRYPMRNVPDYLMPEYACHESNTIVPNYIAANRAERERAAGAAEPPIAAPAALADALDGRWTGSPRIVTLDLAIDIEFDAEPDGALAGRLIGTTLGPIDEPLRNLRVDGDLIRFELPNWQPWSFVGELGDAGELVGALVSSQGGVPVTFRRGSATDAAPRSR